MTYGVFIMAVFLLQLSCDEKLNWDLKYEEADILVVEGKISSELRNHEVRLSRPIYE